MLAVMDRIVAKLSKAALGAIIVLGMVMLFITLLSVFCRYVLSQSLTWGEESLKMLLGWFGLLSVSVISQRREHIGIIIVKERLPKKMQKGCELFTQILLVVAVAVMLIVGVILVYNTRGQQTPALRAPIALNYGAIPVAFAFMTFYEIRNLVYEIMRLRGKAGPQPPAQ